MSPEPIETDRNNICAIDLGIKRYMSAYVKNSIDFNLIYHSEHIFEEYVNITKKIANLQAIAKKENKKRSTKRINRLFMKRRRKLANYMNNIIAHLFRKLTQYKVSEVVIGDLKGIRDAKIPEYFRNKSKVNTMIQNFWSFDIFLKKLENKCEQFGIKLSQIDERGTSSTCPVCESRVKPRDRVFKCDNCGYKQDRDAVGSINIFKKYIHIQNLDLGVENHPALSTVLIES